jgi:hypothetical protein
MPEARTAPPRRPPRFRLAPGEQRSGEFLQGLLADVQALLPPELRGCQARQQWALAKLFYDDPAVHYEAWLHRARARIELGLHFETRDAARNARMLEYVAEELLFLKASLGDGLEAEPWDKGWTRVYLTLPLEPLLPDYRGRVAARFAELIETLEPLRQGAAEFTAPHLAP